MDTPDLIRTYIQRLARLDAAEMWDSDLNPAQIAALDYLACANRFSRAPSHVADYLGTTRGTTSQTLKALIRKGYAEEKRSTADRRSITCDLTPKGWQAAARIKSLRATIAGTSATTQKDLQDGLQTVLETALAAHGRRAFGVCARCAYHQTQNGAPFCALLTLPLSPPEAEQICHEYTAA